ncbi:MAG: hypothetical protein ACOX1L_05000 [Erysipelotrichaceae bacterium]
MKNKTNILAALQIVNREVRLIVGEFSSDFLYIIAKEEVECKGVDGYRIIDRNLVVKAIREAAANISARLKTPLKAVLLSIPGYRFKKERRQFDKLLTQAKVTKEDIKEIFDEAHKINVGSDYEIFNLSCASYRINSIVYPKAPINERSELLSCDIDFICGDRLLMYEYLSIVEKAGLKVLDVYQDGYSSCGEAALFEQSYNNYVVNIYLEADHTVFLLIYNGRLITGFTENSGYNRLIKKIRTRFGFNYTNALRILFRYAVIGQSDGEDRIIIRWLDKHNIEHSLTYQDIQETIFEESQEMIENFYLYCSEIIAHDNVSIVVSGQGAQLQGLEKALSEKFEKTVKCYCPDILGARDPKWASTLGMLYQYKDMCSITTPMVDCVDMITYRQNLIPVVEEKHDGNLADKFKSITDKLFVDKVE